MTDNNKEKKPNHLKVFGEEHAGRASLVFLPKTLETRIGAHHLPTYSSAYVNEEGGVDYSSIGDAELLDDPGHYTEISAMLEDMHEMEQEFRRRLIESSVLTSRTLNVYQTRAAKFIPDGQADEQIAGVTALLVNGCMGLSGESGELLDHVKKAVFQGHELEQSELVEELGDVLWYLSAVAVALGVPLHEVAEGNLRKLDGRYGDGFSEEKSRNRNTEDDTEVSTEDDTDAWEFVDADGSVWCTANPDCPPAVEPARQGSSSPCHACGMAGFHRCCPDCGLSADGVRQLTNAFGWVKMRGTADSLFPLVRAHYRCKVCRSGGQQ